MLKHARRATIALTTSALLATGMGTTPASAARSDVSPQAAKAAGWLAGQLENGLATSEYLSGEEWVSYTDYGLTLDFFFAFDSLGVREPAQRRILNALESQVDEYVSPYGTTYAGALGKLLAAVQEQGIEPAKYGDGNLVARLEERVHVADDSEKGRAKDSPNNWGDSSNTLGQSFVAQALTGAGSPLADEAVKFLLQQQCSNGYFRVYMDSSDHTCDAGKATEQSGPSVDATAAAALALLTVDATEVPGLGQKRIDSALRDAARWLVQVQKKNGSFAEDGIRNSNSTGLAAQALAQLGRNRPAADAASWLKTLRVTGKMARKTAYRRADVGAVAFDKAALGEGRTDGISRDSRYQWRRSTAQAAGGLDS